MKQNTMKAPCADCHRVTNHRILDQREQDLTDDDDPRLDRGIVQSFFIECAGCGAVSLARHMMAWRPFPSEKLVEGDNSWWTYYPSPISRHPPWWVEFSKVSGVGPLLNEIYAAVNGGQHCLAAMGLRSLLEQIMRLRVGEQPSFKTYLDEFHKAGYISLPERDALYSIIETGHAASHRGFKPSMRDLDTGLDIAEGIVSAIFIHPERAQDLLDRVPPRPRGQKT